MKLILELTKEDIAPDFKQSYNDNQIQLHQLKQHHFTYQAMNVWFDADEIWFYRKEYIEDTAKIKLK